MGLTEGEAGRWATGHWGRGQEGGRGQADCGHTLPMKADEHGTEWHPWKELPHEEARGRAAQSSGKDFSKEGHRGWSEDGSISERIGQGVWSCSWGLEEACSPTRQMRGAP